MLMRLRFCAASITCLAVMMIGTSVTRADLLGFYSFDDGGNTLNDDSGSGNTLSQPGGSANPTYQGAGGFQGGGFSFDGGDRLIAPIDVNASAIPRMTWGAWVRTDNTGNGLRKVLGQDNGAWDRAIGLDDRTSAGGGAQPQPSGRYTAFTGTNNNGPIQFTAVPANTTDWTFIAASYDQTAGSMTFYTDLDASTSEPLSATTAAATFGPGFNTFAIGGLRPDNTAEGWEGSIDNAFVFNTALTASQVTNLRDLGASILTAPTSDQLISVDFQADSSAGAPFFSDAPVTFSGAEANSGLGNIWNAVETGTFDTDSPASIPTQNLVASDGEQTNVNLTITGDVLGFNDNSVGAPLTGDYMFFNAAGTDSSLGFELSGLEPGGIYELIAYSGDIASREFEMTVDTNGDGSLLDEVLQVVDSDGTTFSLLTAANDGTITASLTDGNEGNFAGFQLRALNSSFAVPEPSTIAIWTFLGLAGIGFAARRHVRKQS